MKIAIMGEGAFGKVLGKVLTENGHEIKYYDPFTNNNVLEMALIGAEMIFIAVPSNSIRDMLSKLPKDLPLINATKGILTEDIFAEFDDWAVVSGPGFAKDIMAQKQTILTATDERAVELLSREYLRFELTDDRLGVLMCGSLKNAYAIEAGYLGLKPGTDRMQEFLQTAIEEMKLILANNNAFASTVELSCGRGDLELTCSPDSRNYDFGIKVQNDAEYKPSQTTEGVTVLKEIRDKRIKLPSYGIDIMNALLERSKNWI